ncbi:hypothetical protein ACFL20_06300 [Spirochaetota bacterium]
MKDILNKKVEPDSSDRTRNFGSGYFTFHENKVVCYLDIQGTERYYDYLSTIKNADIIEEKVVEKYLNRFMKELDKIDKVSYGIHVLSDSALIIPKSNSSDHHEIPSYGKFVSTMIKLFESLLKGAIPCRFIITKGAYFSIGINDSNMNILPGGEVYLKCLRADNILKGRGPGIYTDIEEIKIKCISESKWDLIDLSLFKDCFENVEDLKDNLNIIKGSHMNVEIEEVDERYNQIYNWLLESK